MRKPKKPKHNCIDYSLYLIKIRDRSVGEMKDKLKKKGYEKEEIKDVVSKLIEKKLLDDERFVENFVRVKLEVESRGRQRIWQDLKKRFIANDLIEKALSKIDNSDEEDAARDARDRYIRRKGEPKDYQEKQKMIAFLGRRGFSWEIIEKIL